MTERSLLSGQFFGFWIRAGTGGTTTTTTYLCQVDLPKPVFYHQKVQNQELPFGSIRALSRPVEKSILESIYRYTWLWWLCDAAAATAPEASITSFPFLDSGENMSGKVPLPPKIKKPCSGKRAELVILERTRKNFEKNLKTR